MLTPRDIHEVGFSKAVFGGYDMESVDDFLEIVADDYAKLYKDNAVLKSKIKVLVDKIEEYRQTEDSMRMALLTAQRTSEDLLNRAKTKSTNIVAGAEAEAEARLADIQRQIELENKRLVKAQSETYEFLKTSRKLIEVYNTFLNKIENSELIPVSEDKVDGESSIAKEFESTAVEAGLGAEVSQDKVVTFPGAQDKPAESETSVVSTEDQLSQQTAEKPLSADDIIESGESEVDNDSATEEVNSVQSEPAEAGQPDEQVSASDSGDEATSASDEVTEYQVSGSDNFDDIAKAVQAQLDSEDQQDEEKNTDPSSGTAEDSNASEEETSSETKVIEEPQDEAALYAATMRLFYDDDDDDEESFSPRPKFDFENLQFGSNYDGTKK